MSCIYIYISIMNIIRVYIDITLYNYIVVDNFI